MSPFLLIGSGFLFAPRASTSEIFLTALHFYYFEHNSFPYDSRGPQYALFNLRAQYTWSRQASHDQLRERLPDLAYGLIRPKDARDVAVEPAMPVWDDKAGILVYPWVDYLNWDPEKVKASPQSIVLFSYDPLRWRRDMSMRFCVTGEVSPDFAAFRGSYSPWVRPRHLVGLPSAPVYELSQYGLKWGLCAKVPRW